MQPNPRLESERLQILSSERKRLFPSQPKILTITTFYERLLVGLNTSVFSLPRQDRAGHEGHDRPLLSIPSSTILWHPLIKTILEPHLTPQRWKTLRKTSTISYQHLSELIVLPRRIPRFISSPVFETLARTLNSYPHNTPCHHPNLGLFNFLPRCVCYCSYYLRIPHRPRIRSLA